MRKSPVVARSRSRGSGCNFRRLVGTAKADRRRAITAPTGAGVGPGASRWRRRFVVELPEVRGAARRAHGAAVRVGRHPTDRADPLPPTVPAVLPPPTGTVTPPAPQPGPAPSAAAPAPSASTMPPTSGTVSPDAAPNLRPDPPEPGAEPAPGPAGTRWKTGGSAQGARPPMRGITRCGWPRPPGSGRTGTPRRTGGGPGGPRPRIPGRRPPATPRTARPGLPAPG